MIQFGFETKEAASFNKEQCHQKKAGYVGHKKTAWKKVHLCQIKYETLV